MTLLDIHGPDPLAGVTAFFTFASTPVGQEVIEDLRTVDRAIVTKIGQLFGIIHARALKETSPTPVAPAVTVAPAK